MNKPKSRNRVLRIVGLLLVVIFIFGIGANAAPGKQFSVTVDALILFGLSLQLGRYFQMQIDENTRTREKHDKKS